MDKLIEKIAGIEASASSIMEGVNDRKAALAKEMEKKTADFDAELEADTAKKLESLRSDLEAKLKQRLAKQRQKADWALNQLNSSYESHHKEYARKIFQEIIKE